MRCEEIRESLPAFADGHDDLSVRRHLSGCADCRAELDRYEAIASGMRALAVEIAPTPSDLLPLLYEIPSRQARLDQVRSHVSQHRKAYVGGAAALAAAGLSALVLARSRRGRLLPT
jgi:hypothetical protein